jgi:recombination protein RecT
MDADRLLKIVMSAASRQPALLECSPESIYLCLHTSGQLGMEPCTPLGLAYFIPFNNKKTGKKEAQFVLGWAGRLDLARRTGEVSSVTVEEVYKGDEFDYDLGDQPFIRHKQISVDQNENTLTHVYAIVRLKDGGVQRKVMTTAQVRAFAKRYNLDGRDMWKAQFVAMAKKTALNQVLKYCPMSIIMIRDANTGEESPWQGDAEDQAIVDEVTNAKPVGPAGSRTEQLKAAAKPQAEPPAPDASPDADLDALRQKVIDLTIKSCNGDIAAIQALLLKHKLITKDETFHGLDAERLAEIVTFIEEAQKQ